MAPALIKKDFYFARHGQTEWNKRQLCQGHQDIELNEAGRHEASLLGNMVRRFAFDRICSSSLKRALETAQIIHSFVPAIPLDIFEELKERGWGELEGISSAEMYQVEEREESDPLYYPGKGVEPREQLQERLARGINFCLQKEGTPLIVSHGRLFLALCDLLKLPRVRQIPNTGLIQFIPQENGWQMTYHTGKETH